ncbi:YcaO-like family protein [Massilia sp. B-10]|nr:YcaO-like family protein [Massilia sp. B-10]
MFADPLLVSSMEDHGYLNALPESRERIAVMLGQAAELAPSRPRRGAAAQRARQSRLGAQRLRAAGLRAIAVEQRVPSLEGPGLKCVKMICPGLLPMTFGHVNRRPTLARIGDGAALAAAAGQAAAPIHVTGELHDLSRPRRLLHLRPRPARQAGRPRRAAAASPAPSRVLPAYLAPATRCR